MANNYWLEQEKVFLKAISGVEIPNEKLENVDSILIKSIADINSIPSGGGCYWIWTNEPVKHSLHKHNTPKLLNGGEIIYNGIAKDDVKGRIFHHLFGFVESLPLNIVKCRLGRPMMLRRGGFVKAMGPVYSRSGR